MALTFSACWDMAVAAEASSSDIRALAVLRVASRGFVREDAYMEETRDDVKKMKHFRIPS